MECTCNEDYIGHYTPGRKIMNIISCLSGRVVSTFENSARGHVLNTINPKCDLDLQIWCIKVPRWAKSNVNMYFIPQLYMYVYITIAF